MGARTGPTQPSLAQVSSRLKRMRNNKWWLMETTEVFFEGGSVAAACLLLCPMVHCAFDGLGPG